jgi:hypothetical protein
LFKAAVMNCFAGSDILLGKDGAAVQMADCMLASDAPAAVKGALRNTCAMRYSMTCHVMTAVAQDAHYS